MSIPLRNTFIEFDEVGFGAGRAAHPNWPMLIISHHKTDRNRDHGNRSVWRTELLIVVILKGPSIDANIHCSWGFLDSRR